MSHYQVYIGNLLFIHTNTFQEALDFVHMLEEKGEIFVNIKRELKGYGLRTLDCDGNLKDPIPGYRVRWRDWYKDFQTYEDAEDFAKRAQEVDPTTKILYWDEREEAWVEL